MTTNEAERGLNSPLRGRGILGSGWQRQTDFVESLESPELPRVCDGLICCSVCSPSNSWVSSSMVSAARLRVTRNCGDSGVGGPSFPALPEMLDLFERVDVAADVRREAFRSSFTDDLLATCSATRSDMLSKDRIAAQELKLTPGKQGDEESERNSGVTLTGDNRMKQNKSHNDSRFDNTAPATRM